MEPPQDPMEKKADVDWTAKHEEKSTWELGDEEFTDDHAIRPHLRKYPRDRPECVDGSGLRVEKDVFGRVSVKHRSAWKYRKQNSGINYSIMTGEEVEPDEPMPEDELEGPPAYVEVLKQKCDAKGHIIGGDGENVLQVPEDYWKMTTATGDVRRVKTSDVQKVVCAALNSRTKLAWLFGVSPDLQEVEGCFFETEQRLNNFVLGIVFAMSNEFFPPLDENTVKVQVIPVHHVYDNDCCIVKMTVDSTTSSLYQLSSGRIFYRGSPGIMRSVDDARLTLIAKKKLEIAESQDEPITQLLPSTTSRCGTLGTFAAFAAVAILGFVAGGL